MQKYEIYIDWAMQLLTACSHLGSALLILALL